MFIDYYKVLEIDWQCHQLEIKKAYKKQAKKWHPDKNPDNDTTNRMQLINEAFLILNDIEARERYNFEYELFRNFISHTQKEPEIDEHEEKEKYQPFKYEDYDIKDEILKQWINNSRQQAVAFGLEIFELAKVGIKEGAKEVWGFLWKIIIINIVFTIIVLILRTCTN